MTPEQASALRTLIAVFLIGLAGWSFVFETLPIPQPLTALKRDLPAT